MPRPARLLARRRPAPACAHAARRLAVAGLLAASLGAAAQTHCAATEQVVFACAAGRKAIAVCATPALAPASGTLQYRFGAPGRVELAYPPAGADWRAATQGGVLAYSGGGGAYLAFSRPPYRYVVYTASGRGWGRKSGVLVEQGGERVGHRACTGPVTSVLGPDLFDSAGIRRTEEELLIPPGR